MKRLLVTMLVLLLLVVATGVAAQLHEHDAGPAHDRQHCVIHATLCCPTVVERYVAWLVVMGLFVAFLTELPLGLPRRRPSLCLDCRGPPAGF